MSPAGYNTGMEDKPNPKDANLAARDLLKEFVKRHDERRPAGV
jgi:hypothetical protein